MASILNGGTLLLTGYVGDDSFGEDSFSQAAIAAALAQFEDRRALTVHINSPGGIATEGAAIHALLSARAGRTDVVVEGIAASAASLIAMAGATVTMSLGAVMMIHDPSGFTRGTVADHEKTVEGLEALAHTYAGVYAAKSGKSVAACREIMRAETWYTPEQAVAAGFADVVGSSAAKPVAAFDYRVFAKAPASLKAMASAQGWKQRSSADPNAEAKRAQEIATDRSVARMAKLVGLKEVPHYPRPAPGTDQASATAAAIAKMRARFPQGRQS